MKHVIGYKVTEKPDNGDPKSFSEFLLYVKKNEFINKTVLNDLYEAVKNDRDYNLVHYLNTDNFEEFFNYLYFLFENDKKTFSNYMNWISCHITYEELFYIERYKYAKIKIEYDGIIFYKSENVFPKFHF